MSLNTDSCNTITHLPRVYVDITLMAMVRFARHFKRVSAGVVDQGKVQDGTRTQSKGVPILRQHRPCKRR